MTFQFEILISTVESTWTYLQKIKKLYFCKKRLFRRYLRWFVTTLHPGYYTYVFNLQYCLYKLSKHISFNFFSALYAIQRFSGTC